MKFTDTNPYQHVPKDELQQLVTKVAKQDYRLVAGIRPETGTINVTLNHLFSKLCHELRSLGITDWTKSDKFEWFVTHCRITAPTADVDFSVTGRGLPDGAVGGSTAQRSTDDGTGTSGTCDQAAPNATVVSDVQSVGRSRKRKTAKSEVGEGQQSG